MNLTKSVLRYVLYPGWLLAVGGAAHDAFQRDVSAGLIVTLIGVGSFALVALFERILPFRTDWNQPQSDLSTDLASFGVLATLVDPALKIASAALALWIADTLHPYTLHLFPNTLPLVAQILMVFLIAEFGKYWAHRWHHEHPLLWDVHAMHHSVERLYALNNFRLHPFNHALAYFLGIFPLALLGVPTEPLLVYSAVAIAASFFQHANIDLRFGLLNYVFSTNELHRWHHSTKLTEGNRNYGSVLIVWDLLFKTHHLPKFAREPEQIGVNDARYPKRGYVKQLLWPYCIRYCDALR